MTADVTLDVLSPGAYASMQDSGRLGYRRYGVPVAGVLDRRLMRLANALAGNAPGAPVIEALDAGLHLAARGGAVRLAVAGAAELELQAAVGRRVLDAWRSLTLHDGDTLRVRRMAHGRIVVVAVEGLALPMVLGSASTYARAGLGGIHGRALAPGMRLSVPAARARQEFMLAEPPRADAGPIRVVPGPQAEHFTPQARATFADADYRVTAEADRMGVRLEGPTLAHAGAPEIVSDATVPGAVQVPGNGQPIVLLADAQTAGGYPKIGTVISADLARVAQARPGQTLRFVWVTAAQGEALARAAEAQTQALLAKLKPLLTGGVDEAALYAANLVSGAVHALDPDLRPLNAQSR